MRDRTLTLYRDDSTVQVVYERVKAVFWTAANTVLVIARWDGQDGDGHHYIHWPRERFCWFKDGGEGDGPSTPENGTVVPEGDVTG